MDQPISNNNEDQRKITPVEIFNKVIFTTKVKATSTNTLLLLMIPLLIMYVICYGLVEIS